MARQNEVNSFLDEGFLRKLEHLRLIAQKRAKGNKVGEHSSWTSGGSLEFLDYRKYQLGDDFRYVDWNVFGRFDKLFIKLFQAEKDLPVHILLDMSLSMRFGEPGKDIYVKKIAAALSYMALANLDQVSVTVFNKSLTHFRPPEKGKGVYLSILEFLQSIEPENETNLAFCLNEFILSGSKSGIVILLSDLLDPAGIKPGLKQLSYGNFDAIVIQVLDKSELRPELNGFFKMEDIETGKKKTLQVNGPLLHRYRNKIKNYVAQTSEFCFERGIDFYLADTSIPFENFLLDLLIKGTLIH